MEKKANDDFKAHQQALHEKIKKEAGDPRSSDVAIPEAFLCPFSRQIMRDPVIGPDGQTYDSYSIADKVEPNNMPNVLLRGLIREWCDKHNKSDLIECSSSTPLNIRRTYFRSLHAKLLSSDRKEAAKELRKEATNRSYFRKLYADIPEVISDLLAPLTRSSGNPEIDPQVQEDLITVLMISSVNEKFKRLIAESSEAVCVLIDALKSKNVKTQRNAASTFFQLCSIDSNKGILGTEEVIIGLATLLVSQTVAFSAKEAAAALFRICDIDKNKKIAADHLVLLGIFQKIKDGEFVDIMLSLLANLSTIKEGVDRIENFGCSHLLRVIRQSLSTQDKETATVILSNVLKKEGSKWKAMVEKEEINHGTLSKIVQSGSSKAKKKAEKILEGLNLEKTAIAY